MEIHRCIGVLDIRHLRYLVTLLLLMRPCDIAMVFPVIPQIVERAEKLGRELVESTN